MIDSIYIEESVLDFDHTQSILQRFPKTQQIVIDRYSEVFNSHQQNFRLQKSNPSLILAQKKNKRVLPTPSQYETGGGANYYFSHMLNCLYDCRYCFLQGMFQSANYLLFVNFEDFIADIKEVAAEHKSDSAPPWFFSGYDCDSLAMEPVTGFADHFLNAFQSIPTAVLELRTKSTQIRSLLRRPVMNNVVVAFSLSPDEVAKSVEAGAPGVAKRLDAMKKLQQAGWRVGARLDPVIWHQNWQQGYQDLISKMVDCLDMESLDSITLGGFRLPKEYFKKMRKLYPDHWLLGSGLNTSGSMVSYVGDIENEMFESISGYLKPHVDQERLFVYPSSENQELSSVQVSG